MKANVSEFASSGLQWSMPKNLDFLGTISLVLLLEHRIEDGNMAAIPNIFGVFYFLLSSLS